MIPPWEEKAKIENIGKSIDFLFEALASTKIQDAQASQEEYWQRILQIVKDVDELNEAVTTFIRDWVLGALQRGTRE